MIAITENTMRKYSEFYQYFSSDKNDLKVYASFNDFGTIFSSSRLIHTVVGSVEGVVISCVVSMAVDVI